MTSEDLTATVVEALDAVGVGYFLSGSFASNYYGIPRATQDADFVVELVGNQIDEVARQLAGTFIFDPQLTFETITGTMRYLAKARQGQFDIEFFLLSTDPHDRARFERRVAVRHLGRELYLPTAEDVLVAKLRWYTLAHRQKDWQDARNVAAVQESFLDWPYVEHWCREHGTDDKLRTLRQWLTGLNG